MNRFLWLFLVFFTPFVTRAQSKQTSLQITRIACEYQESPLGIDVASPRLSWQTASDARNQRQTAYQILVADDAKALAADKGNVWDSGKKSSEESIQIPYSGKPLQAAHVYYWKVKVWDKDGKPSAWSKPASWQMGLLTQADWGKARWIALEEMPEADRVVPGVHSLEGEKGLKMGKHALPQFRKTVALTKPLKKATAFISGLGHYEMNLNGQKVGDHFLDPGWTNYDQLSLYATYDLTTSLKKGTNVFGVMLGNGFYNIPSERYRKLLIAYGYPKMIFKLLLEYENGSTEEVVSDQSWKVTASPITYSSIYGGEDYNASLAIPNWETSEYKDTDWKTPVFVKGPLRLVAQAAPAVKIMETFKPIKVSQPKPGIWIYDLGQNASGIPQITVQGAARSTVKISPGELLDDNHIVTQKTSGDPHYYVYTLKGAGSETWHPQFTYYGFRYLQIEGAVPEGEPNPQGLPVLKDVKGLHVRSSAPRVSEFYCSNELYNQIHRLIDWAIKSNTVSVFTDCPHREKLGWLEEAYLMANSLSYNYDEVRLYQKVINDMKTDQLENGMIPDIAPEFPLFGGGFRDSPEWGSAGVMIPWHLYQWYGDKKALEGSYDMMKKYVGFLEGAAKNNIVTLGLGDWYDLGPKDPGESQLTPRGITATATYYYDLTILAKAAQLLGKTDDVARYQQLAEGVKKAFNDKFFDKEKKQYGTGSQTANAMPLYLDMVEPTYRKEVLANLLESLKKGNYSLTAGDIGFRYLMQVLEKEGASEIIYKMTNRNDVPGYGFQLSKGATALTESWAALRYVSNNHFMLGHLMEWLYSGMGGIRQDEKAVAFKSIVIRPELVGDVKETKTSFQSPYGTIASAWTRQGANVEMQVEIPVNTTATIYVPANDLASVTEGGKAISGSKDIKVLRTEKDRVILSVGSGKYHFKSTLTAK